MPPTGCVGAIAPISPRYRGCQRFPVLPAAPDRSGGRDLFFDARTSATGKSHAVGRAARQIPFEFIATDANGFRVQPRNLGHLLDAAMPAPPGFASSNPASLLFVQTAENQIEVAMVLLLRMIASLTCRTRALPNRTFRCHYRSPSLVGPTDYRIRSNSGIDPGQVLSPDIMPFMIPIAALLLAAIGIVVGGVVKVVKMTIVHRERMEKIAHGMDPDFPPPPDDAGRR
jgi:hypothetical protein